MQVVRQIVDRKSITSIDVPEEFGERVEIIVRPISNDPDISMYSSALHAIQDQTGFVLQVLADEEEDVWNDI